MKPLDLAEYFIDCGVPVFLSKRRIDGQAEFYFPPAWQKTPAELKQLAAYDPLDPKGYAISAVCGIEFDVIDIDPRNGGKESYQELKRLGVLPPVCGMLYTPSGGAHLYVPPSGVAKGSPIEGIDLQSGRKDGTGRGFVFTYPTIRVSKATGNPATYAVRTTPDIGKLRDCNPDASKLWLEYLNENMRVVEKAPVAPPWKGDPHNTREKNWIAIALTSIIEELEGAVKGRDTNVRLNTASYACGQLITGCGMPENWARRELMKAAERIKAERPEYFINRGIKQGKARPRVGGPFTPEAKAESQREFRNEADAEEVIQNYDEYIALWLAKGQAD